MGDDILLEPLHCVFDDGVLCSFRKGTKVAIMGRCWKCPHFKRFESEMDDEDEKVMAEIDEIYRTGVWK